MPKLKTHKGAAKRFKKRGNGSIKHARTGKRHILTKKATRRKGNLRGMKDTSQADRARVNEMLRGQ